MAEAAVMASILTSTTDPTWFRAMCRRCPWATHVSGTDHAGAVLAAVAHVEAAHGAHDITVSSVEDR